MYKSSSESSIPFIIYLHLSFSGLRGAGAYHIYHYARGGYTLTPWTGQQFITGLTYRDHHTHSHSHNSPISLTCMSLDCGRKPEHLEGTPHRKALAQPGPSCSPATVLTTAPPCCHQFFILLADRKLLIDYFSFFKQNVWFPALKVRISCI